MTIADLLHSLSLDTSWLDGEAGDVEGIGWHGLMEGAIKREMIPGDDLPDYDRLTKADRAELATMSGAILTVDNYGNRDATIYGPDDSGRLADDWEEIEKEAESESVDD